MSVFAETMTDSDVAQLRLLSIGHYILAAITAVSGLLPVIHLTIGLTTLLGGPGLFSADSSAKGLLFSLAFTIIPLAIILVMQVSALMLVIAGRSLRAQRRWVLCAVVAAISAAMFPPLGVLLGVATLLVLNRPTVRKGFADMEALHA